MQKESLKKTKEISKRKTKRINHIYKKFQLPKKSFLIYAFDVELNLI